MSWPVGFAEGCRLLRPDAIFHIVAAVNERIAWLNEVRGSEVITPLPTPDRFLSREAYFDLRTQIIYRLGGLAGNFFDTDALAEWTPLTATSGVRMSDKYGSLRLYGYKFEPKFNAEWLYRAYNWLNALLYPTFKTVLNWFTVSVKQARLVQMNEPGKPWKPVYTKAGSTAPVLGGDWIDYAVSSKSVMASYDEEAETISPGWGDNHGVSWYAQGWYTAYNSSTDRSGDRRHKSRVTTVRPAATGNYFTNTVDCRFKWVQFDKWTQKRYGGIVSTPYPEEGTFAYTTLTGDIGEPVSINLYDDPDYTEIPFAEAWADSTKYLSALQFVRPSNLEFKNITLPKPPYSYMLEEAWNA